MKESKKMYAIAYYIKDKWFLDLNNLYPLKRYAQKDRSGHNKNTKVVSVEVDIHYSDLNEVI